VYTGPGRTIFHGPAVGRRVMMPANGRAYAARLTQTG
jgi:hypothetical protein